MVKRDARMASKSGIYSGLACVAGPVGLGTSVAGTVIIAVHHEAVVAPAICAEEASKWTSCLQTIQAESSHLAKNSTCLDCK